MRPIDKLKEIIKDFKEVNPDSSIEDFKTHIEIKYNTSEYWSPLTLECGFMTNAECRRTVQKLFDN